MFPNNEQVAEEIKKEIKKFLETNANENMTTQNLWYATKAVLRRNFTAIQSHLKEQEKNLKQPKLILEATRERTDKTHS